VNESLLIGLVAGAAAVALLMLRSAGRAHRGFALSRLEAKLDALLAHEGIVFDPYSDVPAPVADALRRGKKIEAIKQYRAATGAGLQEAKDFVEELERRAPVR
jgi:hypothetical protein